MKPCFKQVKSEFNLYNLYINQIYIHCYIKIKNYFSSEPLQIDKIVGEHGLVVISRAGYNPESFVYGSDNLYKHKVSCNKQLTFMIDTVL